MFFLWYACQSLIPLEEDTGVGHPSEMESYTISIPAPEFVPATLEPIPQNTSAIWAGVGLLDYDQDGWLDIFLPNGKNAPDALYRNLGDGRFVDVAAEAGVDSTQSNGGVAVADLDNDGDQDLIVNTVCSTGTWVDGEHEIDTSGGLLDGGKILYENLGNGTFRKKEFRLPSSLQGLLSRCTISISPVDINHDGYVDLVFANGHDQDIAPPWVFDKHSSGSRNIILLNDKTGNFDSYLEGDSTSATFAVASWDINQDGQLDLIQAQGGAPMDVVVAPNRQNFQSDRLLSLSGRGLWMGIAAADYNRDGIVDLFTTNQGLSPYLVGYDNTTRFYPGEVFPDDPTHEFRALDIFHAIHLGTETGFSAPQNALVENPYPLAGDLFDSEHSPYIEAYEEWVHPENLNRYGWGWGAVALDANADGWMDIAWNGNNGTAPMNIVQDIDHGAGVGGLLISTDVLSFVDVTRDAGLANIDEQGYFEDGRGIATGDLNNDGYPDLVFANRSYNVSLSNPLDLTSGSTKVWLSGEREGGWLRIQLEGEESTRDALGSMIWVDFGGEERVYVYGAGGQTCSSNEHALYIGTQDLETVGIRVLFPSGKEVVVEDVSVRQSVLIGEWQ